MQSDSSSWRATRSWDADRFELQVGNQGNQVLGCSQIRAHFSHRSTRAIADRFELMASTRATRSWDADRFELMASTRSWDADRFELQVGNQGNQVLGCSQIRAHFSHRSTRAIADRFELQVGNQGNQVLGCSQIRAHFSHRSTRAIADIFELMASTRATRSWDADRFELMASTRSWGCRQIRSHRSTRAIADRFDPTDQPGNQALGCRQI